MMVEGRVNGGGRHLLDLRTRCQRLHTTHSETCADIGKTLKVKVKRIKFWRVE